MMNIYSKTSVTKVLAENPMQIRSLLERTKNLCTWGYRGPSYFKTAWMNLKRLESKAACKILAVTCLYQWLWAIDIHEEARKKSTSLVCPPYASKSVLITTNLFLHDEKYLPGHCEVTVIHRLPRNLSMPKGLLEALPPCWCSEDGYGSSSGITKVSNGNVPMILCTSMDPWRLLSEIQY